jgi:hypothetical protein
MTQARILSHVARWLVAVLAVLAAAEVAAGAEVKGRVLDPEGQPVKGAKVYAIQSGDEREVVKDAVTSDAKGEFILKNIEDKEYRLGQAAATAAGFGVGAVNMLKDKPIEIRLTQPIEVTVPFVDEEGKPVRDLPVRTHHVVLENGARFGSYVRPPKDMPLLRGRTDGNGELRLKNCPRAGRLWLAVDDERFAQLSYDTTLLLSDEETMRGAPIKLARAASVKGRVKYEDGKPASGVRVSAQGMDGFSGRGGDATSDGEGFYQIRQLAEGSYNIALDLAKVNKTWTARAHERVTVTAGQEKRDVDFKLIPGAVIKGKTLAADNGEPIAGVHVMVYGPAHPKSGAWVQGSITEADGSYFLRVPAGEQYLYVGQAQPPEGFLMTPKKEQTLKVNDGQTLVFDFPFPRGPKLPVVSGRVVDEDGKAVGDATILIEPSGRTQTHDFPSEIRSAADGSFHFKLLHPEVKVRAKKDQMATLAAVVVEGNDDQQIDLKLETNALAGIAGTVVDARGDLVVGAKVQLSVSYGFYGTSADTAATGANGTFRINGLWPDGSYGVIVTATGKSECKKYGLPMKPGEILDLGRLEVKDIDSFVSGTVFDLKGNPAPGIRVSINGTKMTPLVVTRTDKDGKFRIPAVSGDTFDLYAVFSEDSITSQKVSAGDENIQMVQRVRRR